jgi:hypothetical protein
MAMNRHRFLTVSVAGAVMLNDEVTALVAIE